MHSGHTFPSFCSIVKPVLGACEPGTRQQDFNLQRLLDDKQTDTPRWISLFRTCCFLAGAMPAERTELLQHYSNGVPGELSPGVSWKRLPHAANTSHKAFTIMSRRTEMESWCDDASVPLCTGTGEDARYRCRCAAVWTFAIDTRRMPQLRQLNSVATRFLHQSQAGPRRISPAAHSSVMTAEPRRALPAMFVNGEPVAAVQCPDLPSEMLLRCAKGPYTTAAVSQDGRVQAMDFHVARLAEAVAELRRTDVAAFAAEASALKVMDVLSSVCKRGVSLLTDMTVQQYASCCAGAMTLHDRLAHPYIRKTWLILRSLGGLLPSF